MPFYASPGDYSLTSLYVGVGSEGARGETSFPHTPGGAVAAGDLHAAPLGRAEEASRETRGERRARAERLSPNKQGQDQTTKEGAEEVQSIILSQHFAR